MKEGEGGGLFLVVGAKVRKCTAKVQGPVVISRMESYISPTKFCRVN